MIRELALPELCGQLIVCGFAGTTLPDELRRDLATGRRGGVILFKRNLPSVEAALELTCSVAAACPRELPPFIGVDQEGGRVRRVPPPFVQLPPMRVLGTIGDPALVRRAAGLLARELRAVGFNLNFAPVLDVDSNPKNPVIGDRSFSSDADTVARLGRAFIEAQQAGGVMGCGKHFPGHGDTSKDSHADLPFVGHGKARLDSVELPPFRAASHAGVGALMTAHVVYEELDQGVPATLSRAVCTTLLRGELGFGGVLFSDDLEMRALSDRFSIEQSAVDAIRAGSDALLVCSDLQLAARAHEALVARAKRDETFRQRCSEAAARSLAARRRFTPHPAASLEELGRLLGSAEAQTLLEELEARTRDPQKV
jgi:beta-N-acetylhexosaminidase